MTITSSYSLFYYYVFPLILTNSLSHYESGPCFEIPFRIESTVSLYGFFWDFLFERMIKVKVN